MNQLTLNGVCCDCTLDISTLEDATITLFLKRRELNTQYRSVISQKKGYINHTATKI